MPLKLKPIELSLSLLDLILPRESSLRYFIWKHNNKRYGCDSVNNESIRFGILYYSQGEVDQKNFNSLLEKLKKQRYKNFNLINASNNLDFTELAGYSHLCFIQEGDSIHAQALECLAAEITASDPDLIYTDEDELNMLGVRINPYFKPENARFLLLSHNYMDALICIKNDVKAYESIKNGINPDSLYTLVLNLSKGKVKRIPKVLYHRHYKNKAELRKISHKKPVEKYLESQNLGERTQITQQKWYNHIQFKPVTNPLVSIIIPFKDKIEFTKMCVESIEQKSTYKNFEIILVNNRSVQKETYEYINNTPHKVIESDIEFNYSRLNNIGAEHSSGEYLVLMNNDIEIITPEWIEPMLGLAQLSEIGVVGPKLLYPNNKIQHVGMIFFEKKGPKHINRMLNVKDNGYNNYNNLLREYLAFTGACIMVAKDKYYEVDGLTEELAIISNDSDFSLKLREKGYINLYCPDAAMYHHESITRKGKNTEEKIKNLNYFYRKWGYYSGNDPYFNPNFSQKRRDFAIRIKK